MHKGAGMQKVVLLRHGESEWNRENRFTGWTDVDLTDKGRHEAHAAGKLLKDEGFSFNVTFTSMLKRAIRTLWIVIDEMDLMWTPVYRSWRLNERHYGALQGLNKKDTAKKYGEEQVQLWRRSYDISPPPLETGDPRFPGNSNMYASLNKNDLPLTECLKDTENRFMPYWGYTIAPQLNSGKHVLIVAHGNSLRSLVKHLDHKTPEEIVKLNIPTGIPLVYELDDALKPIKSYYLGTSNEIKKATDQVKDQGKI